MATKADALNPRTKEYQFFGPPGALLVTISSPLIAYALYFGCSEESGGCPPGNFAAWIPSVTSSTTRLDWWMSLWDSEATVIYLAWYLFCVVAWAILPGNDFQGVLMRNGQKKTYKVNGFVTFICAIGIAVAMIVYQGVESFTFLYRKWVGFVTASLLLSVIQAVYVYLASFQPGKLLSLGGNTGNPIYDFFMGRELNPTIGSLDLKYFNELRPSMILWGLVDISMVCEQAVRRGGLIKVTDSMWLVLAFHLFYIADSLYNETAVFTVMDITTDGLGFMLVFGCLCWIPFVYSLQARYLVFQQLEMGALNVALVLLVNGIGYYIFRAANGEKNDFRNGKNPKNLKYMKTERGSKLLITGWWGRSRHPNYLGDVIMALAWSLPTGFNTPITYFYVIYFSILLLHRERRDNEHCAQKYGKDWERYTKLVPYRIVPYVY
ncbi:erg24, C-14 sterol reductase [Pleurotus ostreatus]|nr:erg24, C-14 sterol reductase [Pleurotus ostreatus]